MRAPCWLAVAVVATSVAVMPSAAQAAGAGYYVSQCHDFFRATPDIAEPTGGGPYFCRQNRCAVRQRRLWRSRTPGARVINQGRAIHDDRPSRHRDRGHISRRQPPARQRTPRSDRGLRRLLGDPAGDRSRQQPELAALRLLRPQSPSAGPEALLQQRQLPGRFAGTPLRAEHQPAAGRLCGPIHWGRRRQLARRGLAARDGDASAPPRPTPAVV